MDFQLDRVLYFTVLSAFLRRTGENEDFYILAGKSHPRERNTERPVFLLIIFICLFCSPCSPSGALSHRDAQQFFTAGSGGTRCIAGSVGGRERALWPEGSCSAFLLCVGSAVLHDKRLFTAVAGQRPVCASATAGEICGCSSPHGSGLLLMISLKKSIILNRHRLMLIPSASEDGVPGMKKNWLS